MLRIPTGQPSIPPSSSGSRKTKVALGAPPSIIADRPAPKPGGSICYPSATELPDGTLALIWTQIYDIPGTLHGEIHTARLRLTDR